MLQGLTQVEETQISPILPIMSLYRLPHGQYGYSGHVINLPQDITSFATSLPRLPSELDVIVVRKEGSNQSHRDFRVRKSIVLRALQWLVANNIYYRNIRIDPDALALRMLPEDGDIKGLCSVPLCDQLLFLTNLYVHVWPSGLMTISDHNLRSYHCMHIYCALTQARPTMSCIKLVHMANVLLVEGGIPLPPFYGTHW